MKKNKSRYNTARRLLVFWTLFIGIGAVGGALAMFIDPSGVSVGMNELLPYFQVLPFSEVLFQNLLFPGISLLVVNGITNLTAAILLLMKKRAGVICGGVFGITLMLWICIQFCILPPNVMSTSFFIFGLCQAVTGYAAAVFMRQEDFIVNEAEYTNIGKAPTRLVVYFSRMGYVKKQAYEEANRTGAAIYEIKAEDKTDGTIGFWWCGRFAMHRWCMPIKQVTLDLQSYDHITICSPIWVFALAAPIRSFCTEYSGKIREVDYILVHHTAGKYENAVSEMDSLLSLKHTGFRSIMCKVGCFKELSV